MKRLVWALVWLGIVTLVALWPVSSFNASSAEDTVYESTTITDYQADFVVDEDGDLAVTETLRVDFPSYGKHGIFRFFDTADPSAPQARRVPDNITVTLDGVDEPFERLTEGRGRYVNVKIGSADVTLSPGEHTYVISYEIPGVIEPGTEGTRSQLYWNLIPGGWRQAIDQAKLTVHLPVAAQGVQCAVGVGQNAGCQATGEDTEQLVVTVRDLAPNTPVTLKTGLDMATPPPGKQLPWTAKFDPTLGQSLPALLVVLAIAAGTGLLGWRAATSAKEPVPGFPLMYAPPEGVGPAQGAYILTESVARESFVASVLQAAEKGAISVDRAAGKVWRITDLKGEEGWSAVDEVTGRIAHLTGGQGQAFEAGAKDVEAGKLLKSELSGFKSAIKGWAGTQGLMVPSGLGSGGGIAVLIAGAAALVLAAVSFFNMGVSALVPGAFAGTAAPLLLPGSGTKRTAAGRDLWSRVGGFHRVLSTPSSEARFDFSGRQELYTQYIPWAVAFGCASQWAQKYRTEVGLEPPVPTYFSGYYAGDSGAVFTDQMVHSFSETVDSAISSYQATQVSSSSGGGGGGGFSGGGGGGGGGGGSW